MRIRKKARMRLLRFVVNIS